MAISQLADYSATPPPTDEPRFRGFERSQQSRGDRSGKVGAEAGNIVADIGRIGGKGIYLLLDYSHKAYDCEAIRLRYNTPPRRQVARDATD